MSDTQRLTQWILRTSTGPRAWPMLAKPDPTLEENLSKFAKGFANDSLDQILFATISLLLKERVSEVRTKEWKLLISPVEYVEPVGGHARAPAQEERPKEPKPKPPREQPKPEPAAAPAPKPKPIEVVKATPKPEIAVSEPPKKGILGAAAFFEQQASQAAAPPLKRKTTVPAKLGGAGTFTADEKLTAAKPRQQPSKIVPSAAVANMLSGPGVRATIAGMPTAQKQPKKAKVIADYVHDGDGGNFLRLSEGEIVDVLKEDDSGWWECRLKGKTGWCPAAFLSAETAPAKANVNVPKPAAKLEVKKQEIKRISARVPIGKARIIGDFKATDSTMLSLKTGQQFQILAKDESGWWEGMIDGETGWAPSNFLEEIADAGTKKVAIGDFKATESNQLTLQTGDNVTVIQIHDSGWCQCVKDGKEGWVPVAFLA